MEFCSGGELIGVMEKMIAQKTHFSEERILKIFSEICESVALLHNLNPPVAHRDLKVENILLTATGECKLCDFGSATRRVMKPETPKEITWVEENINKYTTMVYRAPEMIDLYRKKLINEKVDIWVRRTTIPSIHEHHPPGSRLFVV